MPVVLLAPIAAIILALMAVLLIWGAQAMRDVLSRVFEHVPAIGGRIAHGVRSGFNLAIGAAQAVLDPMIAPLWKAITGPVAWVMRMIDTGVGVVHVLHDTVARIVGHWVPAQLAHLRGYAEHLYNLAVAYAYAETQKVLHEAQHLYNLARAEAEALAATVAAEARQLAADVLHEAQHLYNLARAEAAAGIAAVAVEARQLAAAVLGEAQHLYNLARSYAAELVAAAESRLLARIAQVESDAVTLAREAEHAAVVAVDTTAAAAIGTVWPDIVAGVQAVEGVIATDLPDIGAALRDIDLTAPADLLGTLAGVGALSIPMLRYLERCGIPNCRNLGGFGRELRELGSLVEDGALLAFVAELVAHPQDGARLLTDDVAPVVEGTVRAVRDLIGV